MWDYLAIILAFAAIGLRWWDEPRAAAIAGYGSAACSWIGARRRRREHARAEYAHADVD